MNVLTQKIGIMILILGTSASSIAQEKTKDFTLTVSETIDVSADKVWEIVGPGFANAGVWSTAVDHSKGMGEAKFDGATCNERYCDINAKGFNSLTEKLFVYDNQQRKLAYHVNSGLPSFVVDAQSHWKVEAINDKQSRVTITNVTKMKPFMGTLMGGFLKQTVKKVLPTVASDLKVYAETGEISEEKKKRMEKVLAKN